MFFGVEHEHDGGQSRDTIVRGRTVRIRKRRKICFGLGIFIISMIAVYLWLVYPTFLVFGKFVLRCVFYFCLCRVCNRDENEVYRNLGYVCDIWSIF